MSQGMFNPGTGKWNPSRDDFRYDSSNSITALDMAVSGVGLRKFGIGSKAPFPLRVVGGTAEKGFNVARKGHRAWKKVSKKLDSKLKPVDKSRIGKLPTKRLKATNALKKVASLSRTKKGKGLISLAVVTSTALQSSTNDTEEDETFLFKKRKVQSGRMLR